MGVNIDTVAARLPIRLGQFLQIAGLADSGADAHELISEGDVEVDGEIETRRGRQLHGGEVVTVNSEIAEITVQVVAE